MGECIRHLANVLSIGRIFISLGLFFLEPLSYGYFICYTVCGISDMLDGWIARKTHTESGLGASLDSLGDIVLMIAVIVSLYPFVVVVLPHLVWRIVLVVGIIRCFAYVVGAIKFNRFAALHTYLNKVTGFLLFIFPFILLHGNVIFIYGICGIAFLSAIEELLIYMKSKNYDPNIKSFLDFM